MARQCDPGCHCGTRQRRGLFEGEMARHVNERLLAQHRVFCEHPVEIGAEPVRQIVRLDWPAEPARVEATGDSITNLDPRDTSPIAATSPAPSESGITPSFVGPRPPPFRTIRSR